MKQILDDIIKNIFPFAAITLIFDMFYPRLYNIYNRVNKERKSANFKGAFEVALS